jgi:hypothetical protein
MRDTYAVCCGRDEYSHMRYTAGFLMRRGETGGRSGECVGVDLPIFEGTMRRAREGDEGRDGCAHVTVHVCAPHSAFVLRRELTLECTCTCHFGRSLHSWTMHALSLESRQNSHVRQRMIACSKNR